MTVVYNDGGRAAAGYRGQARDCVVRAIAIATQQPYETVYAQLRAEVKRSRLRRHRVHSPREGIRRAVYERYLARLGWHWVPCMQIRSGCKTHLRADELPTGRLIVRLSRHLSAVIDGVIHDTHDPSRGGTRCVYGYWYKP